MKEIGWGLLIAIGFCLLLYATIDVLFLGPK